MNASDFGKGILVFLGGAAIGVAAGVLIAPHKGSVTRKKIARQANATKESMKNRVADVKDSIEELMEEIEEFAISKKRM